MDSTIPNFMIFHHNDLDGYSAGAIMLRALQHMYPDTSRDQFKTKAVSYNFFETNDPKTVLEEFGFVAKTTIVFLLDLSFTPKTAPFLNKAADVSLKTIWIDHHDSSLEVFNNLDDYLYEEAVKKLNAIVDTKLCGAALTYLYAFDGLVLQRNYPNSQRNAAIDSIINSDRTFTVSSVSVVPEARRMDCMFLEKGTEYPTSIPLPPFLFYVDGHDRYTKYRDERFQLGINIHPDGPYQNLDCKLYDDMLQFGPDANRPVDECIAIGDSISDYKRSEALRTTYLIGTRKVFGHKIYLKNMTGNSDIFRCKSKIFDGTDTTPIYEVDPECMFAIFGAYVGSECHWTYTLVSANDRPIVNKLAQRLGGGGHPHCAGFSVDECLFGMTDVELEQFFMDYTDPNFAYAYFGVPKSVPPTEKVKSTSFFVPKQRKIKVWFNSNQRVIADKSLMVANLLKCYSFTFLKVAPTEDQIKEIENYSPFEIIKKCKVAVFVLYPIDDYSRVYSEILYAMTVPGMKVELLVLNSSQIGNKTYTLPNNGIPVNHLINNILKSGLSEQFAHKYDSELVVTYCNNDETMYFRIGQLMAGIAMENTKAIEKDTTK